MEIYVQEFYWKCSWDEHVYVGMGLGDSEGSRTVLMGENEL